MKTKKKIFLPLLAVIAAVCTSIGISGLTFATPAYAASINKNTFAGYFTAVGGNGLVDYVNDVSYGTFTNTNFSGGGVMVQTQNKKADGDWLINFPAVKYGAGVKFNGVVDISDNTASDTLIELAFPGSNDQAKGIKINIEDAYNPNKYITLFIWHAYANADAVGGKAWMGAAAGTWEKTVSGADVYINEAGFDTEDYDDSYGAGFYPVGDKVDKSGSSAGNGEGCFLNYAEDGHAKANPEIKLNSSSAGSVKVQFDNAEGKLFVNGVRVRDFKNYSADGKHYFGGFKNDKVKISVGVVRSNKGSGDDYAKFCIMNIDGNSLLADGSNNISYSGDVSGVTSFDTMNKNMLVSNFTPVGQGERISYVNNIYYDTFTATFSGAGVMVQTRNKLEGTVSDTNATALLDFPKVKYSTGVLFNGVVDVSDNMWGDTLIELAFPGANDNWQTRGIKVVIEDASDPDKYIALYIYSAYANQDATGANKAIVASAVGTWETINADNPANSAFDTENYSGGTARLVKASKYYDGNGGDGTYEGCFLNYEEHGHATTDMHFARTSAKSLKVQFDNASGILAVNGVHIRDFKNYSCDNTNYFDGFTNDKVKISVSIMRNVRKSTDEFTRFCIMNIDGNDLTANVSNNVKYTGIEDLYDGSEDYVDASSLYLGFSKVGDTAKVNSLSYGEFTGTYINGGGLMVQTRNKAADAVSVTTGTPLISLPEGKYAPGVKLDTAIDVSDNTASDTLIELAFPGVNDNWQARGMKIVIEDAENPDKYIAIFILSSYGNGDATGGGVAVAAAGTWEETEKDGTVYISEAAFDTDNYSGGTARLVKVGDAYDGDMGEGDYEGCFLNYEEHGHIKAETELARTSKNTLKVQFDYENGVLLVNGVHVRDFKNYSTDGENFFDGFTGGKVKVSVGILRSVKKSTDEFTRFCIMNVDGISLKKVGYGSLANKILTDGATLLNYKTITDDTTSRTFKVISGDTYNVGELFDMEDANKYAVGYMVDEDLHNIDELGSVLIGSENLHYDLAYAHFWTATGASVRTGTRTGLRFKGWLKGENANVDETVNIVSEFGMLISSPEYVEDKEFTVDDVATGKLKKIAATNSCKDEDDDTYYYVTMTDIQAVNMTRRFAARSYVLVEYYDGTSNYFYSSYSVDDHARCAYDVAVAAYNDGTNGLTDAQRTFLDANYISKVVEVTALGKKNATGSASYTIDSVSYSGDGEIMYMTVSGANGLRGLSWEGSAVPVGEGHVPDDTSLAMYEQDGKLQIALEIKHREVSTQSKNVISGGTSAYSILIPQNASTTLTYAAEELQDILNDSYGVELPITSTYDKTNTKYISLGDTKFRKDAKVSLYNYTKKQGGFKIKSYGDGVVIYAEDDYSVYYGIYRFLEENFGYKYYAYDCQVINSGSTHALKYFDYEDYPDIRYRSLLSTSTRYAYFANNTERDAWVAADVNNIPLERSALYNNVHLYDTNSRYVRNNWYTAPIENSGRYNGSTPFAKQLDDQSLLTYFLPYDNSWDAYSTGSTYGASNDSWYVKVSGTVKQICFSKAYNNDNGMYDTILNKLKAVINQDANAYATIFEIGIGDNWNYCQCSACSSYGNGKSDVYLRFINKLAGDIKTWQAANCPNREIYLMAYAYMSYTFVPTVETAADNVIIRICPYKAYYNKAYNDSSNYNSDSGLGYTDWKSIFDGWSAKAKNLGVWDYRSDFTDYLEPFPFWKQLENNIEYFKSLGVMEVMAQGFGSTVGNGSALFPFEEMDNYVRSRMLWDTSLSYTTLRNEFIDAYYGAAATYVKNYISAIDTAYGSKTIYVGKDDVTSSKYSSSWVNTVKGYFDSAYSAVSGNAEITRRLDYLSLFYRYLQIKFNYSGKDKATFKTMCANLGVKYAEKDVLVADL